MSAHHIHDDTIHQIEKDMELDIDWYDYTPAGVERAVSFLYKGLGAPQTDRLPDCERNLAQRQSLSLLFGEVKFTGVSKMLDSNHLRGADARVIVDLGMGCGRLLTQAFFMFPNIDIARGVEFSSSRCNVGFTAINKLSHQFTDDEAFYRYDVCPPRTASIYVRSHETRHPSHHDSETKVTEEARWRELTFREQSLFDCHADIALADILVLETNIYSAKANDLVSLLSTAKVGARILCYNRLEDLYYAAQSPVLPWQRLPDGFGADQFEASWGNARFYSYEKINGDLALVQDEPEK